MWIVLPVLSFVFLILFYRTKFPSLGWRAGYILAAVTLASSAVIFIEAASLFSAITALSVRGFWIAMTVVSGGLFGRCVRKGSLKLPALKDFGIFERLCVASLLLIFLINALVAFVAPPNNWDSMTYHLPRVLHWAANRDVHFYPTQIERQLFYPPGAEFCLLHVHLLTHDDRWFNFLQWLSFVGCALSVSLIAGLLGAALRGQILAALFAATIPMAVLQSTSTQNDLFISFWAIAFVALGFMLRKEFSRTSVYAMAATLGLGLLAKGTFFVVFAFLVWVIYALWKKISKHVLAAFCIAGILVAGHLARSGMSPRGRVFLNGQRVNFLMMRHDPAAFAINAICQISSELMLPRLSVNRAIEKVVHKGARLVGVNIGAQKTFGYVYSCPPGSRVVFDEDYASSPLHVVLIIVLPLLLWRMKPKREIWFYDACVIAGCSLFVCVIKWQPWITRLHLPLLILFSPLIGVVMGRRKGLAVWVSALLLAAAFWTIASHQNRPLTGPNRLMQKDRRDYYFVKKRDAALTFAKATNIINSSGCRDVGLLQSGNSWEYPLWALTGYGHVRYRAVGIAGPREKPPCLVVTLDVPRDKVLHVAGGAFAKVWEEAPIQIFARVRYLNGSHRLF